MILIAWITPLVGWARCGDRRHAWTCLAGSAVLIRILVGA